MGHLQLPTSMARLQVLLLEKEEGVEGVQRGGAGAGTRLTTVGTRRPWAGLSSARRCSSLPPSQAPPSCTFPSFPTAFLCPTRLTAFCPPC